MSKASKLLLRLNSINESISQNIDVDELSSYDAKNEFESRVKSRYPKTSFVLKSFNNLLCAEVPEEDKLLATMSFDTGEVEYLGE